MPENETRDEIFDRLTPQQQNTICLMLTIPDMSKVAAEAGVSRVTLYRWMKEPDFRAALNALQAPAREAVSNGLVTLAQDALAVLHRTMYDRFAPAAVRARAASDALAHLARNAELVDVEARMRVLEEGLTK